MQQAHLPSTRRCQFPIASLGHKLVRLRWWFNDAMHKTPDGQISREARMGSAQADCQYGKSHIHSEYFRAMCLMRTFLSVDIAELGCQLARYIWGSNARRWITLDRFASIVTQETSNWGQSNLSQLRESLRNQDWYSKHATQWGWSLIKTDWLLY